MNLTQRLGSKLFHKVVRRVAPNSAAARLIGRVVIDDRDAVHQFWRQPSPAKNDPSAYIEATPRSAALLKLLRDHQVPSTSPILEVGCNVGRNLAYLYDNGYKNVTGVEINLHAVELLRSTYPQLGDREVHTGAAEDILPGFSDGEFDLTFTMAVLQHIHPDSRVVFREISRISERILAIEPTISTASHRTYPHDIVGTFKRIGWHVSHEVAMKTMLAADEDPGGLHDYTAWWFDRS